MSTTAISSGAGTGQQWLGSGITSPLQNNNYYPETSPSADMQIRIRSIENGFILSFGVLLKTAEVYCATAEDISRCIVAKLVEFKMAGIK
jgi:hypothetical protein